MTDPFRVKGLTRAQWRLVLYAPLTVLGIVGAVLYPGFKNWRAGASTPCGELLSDQQVVEHTGREVNEWVYSKSFLGCDAIAYPAHERPSVMLTVKASCRKQSWAIEKGFQSVEPIEGLPDAELATFTDSHRIQIDLKPSGCITAFVREAKTQREGMLRLAHTLASHRESVASYVAGLR